MKLKIFSSIGIIFLCSSVLVLAALDLRFTTAITQSPDPANAGDNVIFTVTFKTFGGAVDNLKITGGVDGINIFERTYFHINADSLRTDSFTWMATAGSHTVWFELDPAHTCGDSNYNNNRVEKAITISSVTPVLPNLTVTDCVVEPSTYKNGDKVLFKFNIKNIGAAPVTVESHVDILLDGALLIQWKDFPGLPAGTVVPCAIRHTVKIPSTIIIKVDATSLITESNENDNTCGKAFKIIINKPKKSGSIYKP